MPLKSDLFLYCSHFENPGQHMCGAFYYSLCPLVFTQPMVDGDDGWWWYINSLWPLCTPKDRRKTIDWWLESKQVNKWYFKVFYSIYIYIHFTFVPGIFQLATRSACSPQSSGLVTLYDLSFVLAHSNKEAKLLSPFQCNLYQFMYGFACSNGTRVSVQNTDNTSEIIRIIIYYIKDPQEVNLTWGWFQSLQLDCWSVCVRMWGGHKSPKNLAVYHCSHCFLCDSCSLDTQKPNPDSGLQSSHSHSAADELEMNLAGPEIGLASKWNPAKRLLQFVDGTESICNSANKVVSQELRFHHPPMKV